MLIYTEGRLGGGALSLSLSLCWRLYWLCCNMSHDHGQNCRLRLLLNQWCVCLLKQQQQQCGCTCVHHSSSLDTEQSKRLACVAHQNKKRESVCVFWSLVMHLPNLILCRNKTTLWMCYLDIYSKNSFDIYEDTHINIHAAKLMRASFSFFFFFCCIAWLFFLSFFFIFLEE